MTGRATAYDLRLSLNPITNFNFSSALRFPASPTPALSGMRETITVSGLVPGTTYHFALKTRDDAGNWSGISNVKSKVATGVLDAMDSVAPVLKFSPPFPNPARASASFKMALPERMDIDVIVFDVMGRQIRTLAEGEWPAGEASVAWNLRDNNGVRVSAGSYLVRARLGRTTMVRSVVVMG